MRINVEVDFNRALGMLDNLAANLQGKVLARTLNRIGEQTKVEAVREISREYNVPASEVRKKIVLSRASAQRGRLFVDVDARARKGRGAFNLIRFVERSVSMAQARRRRKDETQHLLRIQVKRRGGKKILGKDWPIKPFIMRANSATIVAVRSGRARLPVEPVTTIGVPSMFSTKRINAALRRQISAKFPVELRRQLDAALRGF
jgi:hypothetical protein